MDPASPTYGTTPTADDDDYPDFGGEQLTNGDVAEEGFYGVGFSFRNAEVTIDLDSVMCLSNVLVCVGTGDGGRGVPSSVDVQLSDDNAVWYDAAITEDIHQLVTGTRGIQWVEVELQGKSGRYVKVNVERDKSGGKRWIMLNEIQVTGCSGGVVDSSYETYGFPGDLWVDIPLHNIDMNEDMSMRLDLHDTYTIEFFFQLTVPIYHVVDSEVLIDA